MCRVDNFLRTTHWIAESWLFSFKNPPAVEFAVLEFMQMVQYVYRLDEQGCEDTYIAWVQWWIDRLDTCTIRVPCNGGVM